MPAAAICYFSQTGTTRTIAEKIAQGLTGAGASATLLPMGETDPEALGAYDIIGIGMPVYMFRPPFIVMDFLKGLPDLTGKYVFTFVLFGSHPGSTASITRTLLAKKGGRDLGLYYSHGDDLFAGYVNQGTLLSPDRPNTEEKNKAIAFGRKLFARFQEPDFKLEKDDQADSIVDIIERAATHRFLARNLYSRLFVVSKERCNGCGLCQTLCPTANITLREDGRPRMGRECLLCLSCELRCPKEAIASPFTSVFMAPVMKFNLWQGKRQGLEHMPVRWARGKVNRLVTDELTTEGSRAQGWR